MKKILVITITLAILGASFLIANPGESKTKPYYSGDAVNYKGVVYIGTTNSGNFELFALENGNIYKKTAIASNDQESKQFTDLMFDKENGKLIAYLTNGRYLYKYDISNPTVPTVVLKIKDNSWDWFSRIEKVNGRLATIGSKGLKIWNKDYQVIEAYSAVNDKVLGTTNLVAKNNIAINIGNDKVTVYDLASQKEVSKYGIASNDKRTKREAVSDDDRALTYLVDDVSLKAVDFSGKIQKEYKHVSNTGYDVANSAINPDQLYFSDGLGVVKVDKETLKPVKWAYTTENGLAGSWAMGLKAVNDGAGEKVVVFNGSNILVLDQNMKAVANYEAIEQDVRPIEDLSIGLDKNRAAAGSDVVLHGAGFGLGEELKIEFAGTITKTKADQNGRFMQVIVVPSVLPGMNDIKVTGKDTKRTYSIAFKID